MERYSRWGDGGTGIQPFLLPVSSAPSSKALLWLHNAIAYPMAIVRLIPLSVLGLSYVILVEGLGVLLSWSPGLSWNVTRWPAAVLGRMILFILGYAWLDYEMVNTKRGKGTPNAHVPFEAQPGDIIVANWTSYIELIYLAYRFNPTFLLPIHHPVKSTISDEDPATTGRHTGTGSANLPSTSNEASSPLIGYVPIGLLPLIAYNGHTPQKYFSALASSSSYLNLAEKDSTQLWSLEQASEKAVGPIVVLPEGTTGNGRGLLRFGQGWGKGVEVPVKRGTVWLVYFKHPPPTTYTPSANHTIPSSILNPLPHLISTLNPTLAPRSLGIRVLHPFCSPSSGDFLPSETLNLSSQSVLAKRSDNGDDIDVFGESCQALLLQLGRTKQVGLGWEDKVGFLEYVDERNHRSDSNRTRARPKSRVPSDSKSAGGGGLQARRVAGRRT